MGSGLVLGGFVLDEVSCFFPPPNKAEKRLLIALRILANMCGNFIEGCFCVGSRHKSQIYIKARIFTKTIATIVVLVALAIFAAMNRLIIIGGGAAGFFTAIRCAQLDARAQVTILERGKEVLGKVKVSGGGRCNLTHACFVPAELVKFYPRGHRELLGPFHRFGCGDTMAWFEQHGVKTKIEADGRVFPVSNSSQSVIDCLTGLAKRNGVTVALHQRVDKISPPQNPGDPWQIWANEQLHPADKVMIATGSNFRIWEILAQLGHTIIPPAPSLFTFNIKDARIAGLEGISVPNAEVTIPGHKLTAEGPLLITHWGLSGPGILRLSAWGARILAGLQYRFPLEVNWVNESPDAVQEQLDVYKKDLARQQVTAHPQWGLPARLWRQLCTAAGIEPALRWADLNKNLLQQLGVELVRCRFSVNGKSTFKEEFVTAGGIDLKEVNFKTFGSKLHPGLFFAGEVLDIDAITGGFNFQAAWTGAWLAAEAMTTS